jgi:23S rRNA (uracil1939-C5)-methyltransferase
MVKLQIDKFVYGGDSMGRLEDGRVAFVPFVLPGELVEIEVLEDKRGFVRGGLTDVLEESPKRIKSRCKHYMECGGCHYQHISYQDQLEAKTGIVVEQLQRIGGIEEVPVQEIIASDDEWNYRNNVQFHLDKEGKLGFMAGRSDTVIPIEECFMMQKELAELWSTLSFGRGSGIKRISLRLGMNEELMMVFETYSDEALDFSVDFPINAVQLGPDSYYVLSGNDFIHAEISGREFKVTANAFFQVNSGTAGKMVEYLLDIIPLQADSKVLDIYCGVGLFSAFIAPKVEYLVGVESHPQAVDDFVDNLNKFENVELYEGRAEEVLKSLEFKPDVILVDPPRSGLNRHVLDMLVDLNPKLIAYVSCDPSTLARDAKRLISKGYSLKQVTPVDMFPQTFHIETISLWEID